MTSIRKISAAATFYTIFVAFATWLPKHKPGRAPASVERFQELTEFFENEVATRKIPGAVILIQQHGKPIYLRSFGVRDVTTNQPMSPDTIFAIKSMTKPITSVAAMMLVDEGKLALKDPLHKYIPEFANVKVGIETSYEDGQAAMKLVAPRRPVTIEDLLRHTSGITYGYIGGNLIKKAYTDANLFAGKFNNKVLAERIAKLPLSRQPGTLWRYGHSTDVLGRVIEVASGETLYHFQKTRILDPLGMTSTKYFLESEDEQQRMAAPFPQDTILIKSEQERVSYSEWESGGGGLVSTITDYAKFAQMILNGGQLNGKRYLSAEAFQQMTADHIGPGSGVTRDYFYFPGDGFGFGYGLAIRTEPGKAVPPPAGSIGELKWDSGSGTYFGVDPELDMVFILLMQTQNERGRIVPRFKQLVYQGFQ